MANVVNRASPATSTRTILEYSSLEEALTFDQLFAFSEPKRVLRSKTVRGPALGIESSKDSMYYWFNVKAFPSTEGRRHKGYIKFLKPEDEDTPLEQTECVVDCSCKDFKFVWSWANTQHGSSEVGPDSLNQCWDQAPRIKNPQARPGLCKHLLSLRNFLYGQDSKFPPSDEPEGPSSTKAKLVKKAQERSRMELLARAARGAVIDQNTAEQLGVIVDYDEQGYPVAYRTPDGQEVRPGDEPHNQPGGPTQGSALDAAMRREIELRRRQQARTQGENPDDPENEPTSGEQGTGSSGDTGSTSQSNPTNPTNPTNEPNRSNDEQEPPEEDGRPPRRRESVISFMDDKTIKIVQEMVDAAQAAVQAQPPAAKPATATQQQGEKSQSQQALDYLKDISALMAELVQLQQTPEPPAEEPIPAEPGAEDQEGAPADGPVVPAATPSAQPPAPRQAAGPRPHRLAPQL